MRQVFNLPSPSTLHSWLRKIPLSTGWSKPTLAVLKKKAETLAKEETLCGIVFDAMSIKESLHFDKASDSVIGREDFTEHGKRGINTFKIRELYEASIKKVQESGMKVMFTVCDQEGAHRSLFQTLGMTQENPSFIANDLDSDMEDSFMDDLPEVENDIVEVK
ncbi:hypothetical protein E2C01_026115 [Portunus trituberculatus]|uniref:Transposable element P transposase-like RNase H domain-containing protein n=1 Tax=Portunus trituberculatus TaxID=210409 RepID=A0A5B7EHY6_PORTR|nr:hypothetical protein [Portunus trituberculatus]